jgi:hypothetical protein
VNANERKAVYRRFRGAINLKARQLRQWLDTTRRRRSASNPGRVCDTRWRYSLMNWGHDPLR